MKFDSNQAWKDSMGFVRGNREVLLAIAGVFFMLPALALTLFMPQPEPPAGASVEVLQTMMAEYYAGVWPFMLLVGVLSAIGSLALLTLYTDRSRPTVSEAIRRGVRGMAPYLIAQLLIGLVATLVGGLFLGIAMASGFMALTVLVAIVLLGAFAFLWIRTCLVAPIIGIESERNPITALRRSWRLTQGNVLPIGLFFLLVGIAMLVIFALAMAVVGIVLALIAGGEPARAIAAVASSALTAAASVVSVAMLAAVHRQLGGPTPEAIAETFD